MENRNWRILVLWKTRIGEFFFFFNPEFRFCGKRELEDSRFVENLNRRIFFFFFNPEFSFCGKRELENSRFVENQNRRIFFFFYPRISVLWKQRILVLWKTGTGEFSFCEKPESENFFFFNPEFSFSGKREMENSRFVENQNRRFFFFFYPRILVLSKRRILVLWKTGTGEFSFCEKPESEKFFFFL